MNKLNKFFSFLIEIYQNKKFISSIPSYINNVIDVGAHEGELYKSFIYNKIKFDKFIMFEPHLESFNLIKNNINDEKVEAYRYGISDVEEIRNLNVNKLKLTNTFAKQNKESLNFKIKNWLTKNNQFLEPEAVELKKLDNFLNLNMLEGDTLLKIDTEGYELKVLRGAKSLIENKKIKFILIEIHKKNTYFEYDPSEVFNFLKQNNYILIKEFKFPLIGFSDILFKLSS